MSRITALNPAQATGKAKQFLSAVQARLGLTPNLMRVMANSPAVLESYLNFSSASTVAHLMPLCANKSRSPSQRSIYALIAFRRMW